MPAVQKNLAAEAPDVHFQGTFFDLLVHLNVEYGTQSALDQSLMRDHNTLTGEASFGKRPGESVQGLMERFARDKGWSLRANTSHYHFTDAKAQKPVDLTWLENGAIPSAPRANDPLTAC